MLVGAVMQSPAQAPDDLAARLSRRVVQRAPLRPLSKAVDQPVRN
jgi:hypothetical protein